MAEIPEEQGKMRENLFARVPEGEKEIIELLRRLPLKQQEAHRLGDSILLFSSLFKEEERVTMGPYPALKKAFEGYLAEFGRILVVSYYLAYNLSDSKEGRQALRGVPDGLEKMRQELSPAIRKLTGVMDKQRKGG